MTTTCPAGNSGTNGNAQGDAGCTLVINLTRFGDLLQCQPLIEDLNQQGQRVHLVCLDNFSSALPLMRHGTGFQLFFAVLHNTHARAQQGGNDLFKRSAQRQASIGDGVNIGFSRENLGHDPAPAC
jgi:hypothetical protein